MTDLEMTTLCAESLGLTYEVLSNVVCINDPANSVIWNPLHDNAQAMALLTQFKLVIEPDGDWAATWINRSRKKGLRTVAVRHATTLNRAIVECVVEMQLQREQLPQRSEG